MKYPFLSIQEEEEAIRKFTASQSWASKFANESGWKSKMMHGEASSVDINQPEIKETINQII
jgi:hypothetical protein